MKIVNRKTFLGLPSNTLYSKYAPCFMDGFEIKGDTCGDNDFLTQDMVNSVKCKDSNEYIDLVVSAEAHGTSMEVDLDNMGRDGLFDDCQLFAVWEERDVKALIDRLALCLKSGEVKP